MPRTLAVPSWGRYESGVVSPSAGAVADSETLTARFRASCVYHFTVVVHFQPLYRLEYMDAVSIKGLHADIKLENLQARPLRRPRGPVLREPDFEFMRTNITPLLRLCIPCR